MTWPSYGQGVLRALLRGSLEELDPPPSSVHVLQDARAEPVTGVLRDAAFAKAGLEPTIHVWDAAESRKTLAEAEALARAMVRAGVDRSSLVVAIGGGVTTDMGGFLAAMLLRGVRWGAVPTTLLAMADAALGGKTAVDLPEGKNLLGAFHMPEFVICDVDTLATLPPREWSCGLGEVLKSALIGDQELLDKLESAPAEAMRRTGRFALDMALSAGEVKMQVASEDPTEQGQRKVLNLGHTFGHALETAAGHSDSLAHGEAVGLGLLCAARMAEEMQIAQAGLHGRLHRLLRKMGLPTRFPGKLPSRAELSELLKRDKKARSGKVDLVLPVKPGECLLVRGVDTAPVVAVMHRELADG